MKKQVKLREQNSDKLLAFFAAHASASAGGLGDALVGRWVQAARRGRSGTGPVASGSLRDAVRKEPIRLRKEYVRKRTARQILNKVVVFFATENE
jgi:transposase-like protein